MATLARAPRTLAAIILLICSTVVTADEPRTKPTKAGQYNPADRTVEMFEGIKSGQLDVKLIPKDSTQGRVIIANKGDVPVNVKLPQAFVAVPILAQMGGMGGNRGGMGGGGMMQSMGGGMGGMGGGGMGGGGMMGGGGGGGMFNVPVNGAGMFNVAAKKTGDFKVTTVCLEHGKPEPRSTVAYEIRPLETFTEKQGVYELLQALGYGQIDQRVAQAAAWNLNNGMSWATLAAKRIERADGDSYPYFSPLEIQLGAVASQTSLTAADATAKTRSVEKAAPPVTGAAPSIGTRQP
jgi:hypothetical protein